MFGAVPMFASSLSGGYGQSQPDVAMDGSQGSPQKGQAGGDSNALVPVTIRMMEKAAASQAPGAELRVDGREANMMIVVGAIEELNRQQASMEFVLNDSTGRMKARFFFPSDVKVDSIQNGKYVSAVGVLKTQPSTHFSLVALHPVQSPDQISYHMIEVAHSSLRSKNKMASKAGAISSPMKEALATVPRPLVSASGTAPIPMETKPVVPATVDSRPLKEQIASFLAERSANPEGVGLAELNAQFNAAGAEGVRAALNQLLDDGSAYTTIDDSHFASI